MAQFQNFWEDIWPNKHNHSRYENITIDVANKGCFSNYDTVACISNAILTTLGLITFVQCVIRVIRFHLLHHPQPHHYLIFYLAALESALLSIDWIVGKHLIQLEFAAVYLKGLQFLFLCHFHWSLAARILHQEKLIIRIILPILLLFFVYFTFITTLAMINPRSPWTECLEPHWILLSAAEFLAVQLFMTAGIYITQKINSISALESFKREQKRDLWSVIAVFEFSALISLTHDVTVLIMGNDKLGCSGIYGNSQIVYSPIFIGYMLVKFLSSIWVMLLVLNTTRGTASGDEERLLAWSGDGSVTSVFSSESRRIYVYKNLHLPVESDRQSPPVISGLRRCHSTPAFLAALSRENLLPPISEEESISHAASHPNYSNSNKEQLTAEQNLAFPLNKDRNAEQNYCSCDINA